MKWPGISLVLGSVLLWFVVAVCAYAAAIWLSYSGFTDALSTNDRTLFLEGKALLGAFFSSFIFYFLVVFLPAARRKKVLRENCRKMYRATKGQILYDILSASQKGGKSDIDATSDLVDALMEPQAFKKMFEGRREGSEGFYAFSNHIQSNETDLRSLVFKFKLVARQLEFLLNNYEMRDQEQFGSLKRIEEGLFELDTLHAGHDEGKVLDRMIWAVFAGWSFVDGYRGYDIIEKAIDQIS